MKLDKITTGYHAAGRRVVVQKDMSAFLADGELTCLLGPNGAGKTTLLRTMAGFIQPLEGEISISGIPLCLYTSQDIARKIGVVLTDKVELSSMTVNELVSVGRSPYTGFWGHLSDSDKKIVDESIHMTQIEHLQSRRVNTLSDGERQRVMLAKALAQQTKYIFLDEPTAYLDYPGKADTLRMLREIAHTQQKSILISTHDLNMAMQLSDTIWLLDKQHGLQIGAPRELAEKGDIALYFERKGITFDPTEMQFKVKK